MSLYFRFFTSVSYFAINGKLLCFRIVKVFSAFENAGVFKGGIVFVKEETFAFIGQEEFCSCFVGIEKNESTDNSFAYSSVYRVEASA